MKKILSSLLLVLGVPWLAVQWQDSQQGSGPQEPSLTVPELLGGEVGQGFARPLKVREFRFPEDHAPHPDFRTEWWYFTGNLRADEQDLGYQLTFFRQALLSPAERLLERHSKWSASHAWMAHFAISDPTRQNFHHFQKLSREAIGLAGYRLKPLSLWVENWRMEWLANEEIQLHAQAQECQLDLRLKSLKPVVLQGNSGLSQKGPDPGQSSYYYSLTRLQTQGKIRLPGLATQRVTGLSWMDREWSTQPLAKDLVGWDWFSLQLSNGEELMYYQLRDRQGQATPHSSGSWVRANGEVQACPSGQVQLEVTAQWKSPIDGSSYPAGWNLSLSSGMQLKIQPKLANQEMTGVGRYWEGAVAVQGIDALGKPIQGSGYVELVGYGAAGAE